MVPVAISIIKYYHTFVVIYLTVFVIANFSSVLCELQCYSHEAECICII